MDGALIAIWSAIGISALSSIGGWIVAYNNKSSKESQQFGELKGEIKGLHNRVAGCEKSTSNLSTRIDFLITTLRNNRKV